MMFLVEVCGGVVGGAQDIAWKGDATGESKAWRHESTCRHAGDSAFSREGVDEGDEVAAVNDAVGL